MAGRTRCLVYVELVCARAAHTKIKELRHRVIFFWTHTTNTVNQNPHSGSAALNAPTSSASAASSKSPRPAHASAVRT